MTVITITFICCFAENVGGKGNKGKIKKEPKNKKGKKNKTPDQSEVQNIPTNILNVKNPTNFIHIEYDLLPDKPPCSLDVVSWGLVTKVFGNNCITTMKSFKTPEKFWIAFTVEHIFILSNQELTDLNAHTVTVNMWLSKGKMKDNRAKADKTKVFYFRGKDLETNAFFVNAYDKEEDCIEPVLEDADEQDDSLVLWIRSMIEKMLIFPAPKEVLHILKELPVVNHRKPVQNIIDKIMSNKEIDCINEGLNEIIPEPISKGKKGKKTKPKKQKKKKKNDNLQLKFRAELFFTDPFMVTMSFKDNGPLLPYLYMIFSVTDLMLPEQKLELNPFVIKIHKLQNLPVDILKTYSFRSIYGTFSVGNIFSSTTSEREITNDVCFKEHHAYFTNECLPLQYIETIQSGYIVMKLYGNRPVPETKVPKMFGKSRKDKNISKCLTYSEMKKDMEIQNEIQQTSVLLLMSFFKLDSLYLHRPHKVLSQVSFCVIPDNIYVKNVDLQTMEDKLQYLNPLTDEMLTNYGTSVDIEVDLSFPFYLRGSWELKTKMYGRILLIINDRNYAKNILTLVLKHNKKYLGSDIIIPDYLSARINEIDPLEEISEYAEVLTGFIIDTEPKRSIMFFEGRFNGIMNFLWLQLSEVKNNIMQVFYNSRMVFENRLYWNFISYGGVYIITLHLPVSFLLTQKRSYIQGYYSKLCRRAILKLDLIMRSRTTMDFLLHLLPQVKELLSLDLECGVPLRSKIFSDKAEK